MNVAQYTFVSPYPSSFQVGHLDPSSLSNSSSNSADTTSLLNASNQTLTKAKEVKASITSEVKPTLSSANKLDIYA